MSKVLSIFLLILLFSSCIDDDLGDISIDPEIGWFPQTPVNISELNTAFDDYNSDLNSHGKHISLYYSNNADKKGSDFDISGVNIDITVNEAQEKMSLEIANSAPNYASQLLPLINSTANEVGPFSFNQNIGANWYFFYANDENGQYDIKYLYEDNSSNNLKGPFYANVLNSNVCDFYPSINTGQNKIYFSSYRNKKYDLYEIDIIDNDLTKWLNKGDNQASLNQRLSSNEDDKCPYINGKLMVFASDRYGGFGGYDLWYSILQGDEWSSPVNFGPEINTEYDEFRPAVEFFRESNNDFMIFSSNRKGGQGGYDLYFVGIPKMTK